MKDQNGNRYVREINQVLNEAADILSEKDFMDLCNDIKDNCCIRLNGELKIRLKIANKDRVWEDLGNTLRDMGNDEPQY